MADPNAFGQGVSKGFWAGGLGSPVDLSNLVLNLLRAVYGTAGHATGLLRADQMPAIVDNPVGGSEWIAQKMRQGGLLADQPGTAQDSWGQAVGNIVGPLMGAKAPQIASAMNQGAANLAAPRTMHPQAGAVDVRNLKAALLRDLRAAQNKDPYGEYGVRVLHGDDVKIAPGAELPPSYAWEDGVSTGQQYGGTAVFGIDDVYNKASRDLRLAEALTYRVSGSKDRIGVVKGSESLNHDMPELYAELFADAKLLASYERPRGLSGVRSTKDLQAALKKEPLSRKP